MVELSLTLLLKIGERPLPAPSNGSSLDIPVVELSDKIPEASGQTSDSREEEPLPAFEFPDQAVSLPVAFRELFELWGLDYRASESPVACEFAEGEGLRCLQNKGARRSLEFLGPAGDTSAS